MSLLKKIISSYMYRTTLVLMAVILILLMAIQLFTEQLRAVDTSRRTLRQIEQVLAENNKELAEVLDEYEQSCLNRAETVARIIESDPEVMYNTEELKEIAASVEVDEIHIFDASGSIFTGTHPQYYGYNFESGEQISFFKPMLEDKSLKLVQEITPNTAEEKPMQYSAVWSENGELIVQVGMEPVNVEKVTAKNEISYIFSLFRVDPDVNYYAINRESGEIVGSTDMNVVGCLASEVGFEMSKIETDPNGFHNNLNGTHSFCVFEQIEDNYVGRVVPSITIYHRVPVMALLITLSLITVSFILVKIVVRHMDKYVVQGIHNINGKLQSLSEGKLDEVINERDSVEFSELSDYINTMVKSLIENNNRMSYVISKTNLHIGTYEYSPSMKKVRYTEYIPLILGTDNEIMEQLSEDTDKFKAFLYGIRSNSIPNESGVYKLGERYVRIEETDSGGNVFGVAIDITDEVQKRKEVERERDIDALTGLYNRRGFDIRLAELLEKPEALGHSAIIMIDADGLKGINDSYGHDKGDIYLKKIAGIIRNYGIKSSITARYGGDEFVLFMYDYDSENELLESIETLRYMQENSIATLDKEITVPLRFSFGYCVVGQNPEYKQLFRVADENMYKNKEERKKQLLAE